MGEILQYKFLAEMNGRLCTGQKSLIADKLTKGTECPASIDVPESATLITDGQTLVICLGRPTFEKSFGDFAEIFISSVYIYRTPILTIYLTSITRYLLRQAPGPGGIEEHLFRE